MLSTITVTPVVARALEAHRQKLDADNSMNRIHVELEQIGISLDMMTPAISDAIYRYGQRCAAIGELNGICATAGVTEYVMSTMNNKEA